MGSSLELAKSINAVRSERRKHFNPRLFDEHSWDLLLTLFIAREESRDIRQADLIDDVVSSPELLGRWTKLLASEGLINVDESNDLSFSLSDTGHDRMLASLSPENTRV